MLDLAAIFAELSTLPTPLRFAEIFGDDRAVELEVGPGKGLFLLREAAGRPDRGFIGVEYSRKYAKLIAEKIAKHELKNVKIVYGDALTCLARHVGDSTLATVHIYFPDPWWKKRHKKRRVFRDRFVEEVARTLKVGGELRAATDVEEYFGVMTDLLAARTDFEPLSLQERNIENDEPEYLTNFERKYRVEGRSIYRAVYRLIGKDDRRTGTDFSVQEGTPS